MTFTKEQLIEQAQKNIAVLRGAAERIPGASEVAVIHLRLAEITLAALTAEPVVTEDISNAIEELKKALVSCHRYNYCSDAVKRLEDACRNTMLQRKTDGSSPLEPDVEQFLSHFDRILDERNDDIDIGQLACRNQEALFNAAGDAFRASMQSVAEMDPHIERSGWVGAEPEPLHTAPPAPVSVPADVMAALQKVARIRLDLNDFDGDRRGIADCLGEAEEALIKVVNRRAAMLQGKADGALTNEDTIPAEPVTTLADGVSSAQYEPPERGWVVTHGGKDYFHREQSDAVTHLHAAFESGRGVSLRALHAEPVGQPARDAYDIEAFGFFSAAEGRNGLNLQIEQFHFVTEKCPPIGKKKFVPKFAFQAIINRLQEHCDSMSIECSIDLSGLAAPQQEAGNE